MSLTGTFKLKSNDNYEAWLKAVGVPAEIAARMCAAEPTLEVTKCDGGVTVKTTAGEKVFTNSVVFGQDSDATVAGLKYTLNVTTNSKGFSGTVKLGGKTSTVTVEVDDAGFKQILTVDGITGGRTYSRV